MNQDKLAGRKRAFCHRSLLRLDRVRSCSENGICRIGKDKANGHLLGRLDIRRAEPPVLPPIAPTLRLHRLRRLGRRVAHEVPRQLGTGRYQVPGNSEHARHRGMGSKVRVRDRSWRRQPRTCVKSSHCRTCTGRNRLEAICVRVAPQGFLVMVKTPNRPIYYLKKRKEKEKNQ